MTEETAKPPVAEAEQAVRHAPARLHTFTALRNRDYRLLWIGMLLASSVMPMQIIAQALLVGELEPQRKAFWLGWVFTTRGSAFLLFAFMGGALADRFSRRNLLILTQAATLLLTVAQGLLITLDVVALWHVFILGFLMSAVLSWDQPTRQALVPELVSQRELLNAVALLSMAMQGAMALAPMAAGPLIGNFGLAVGYYAVGVGNLGIIVVLLMMRYKPSRKRSQTRGGFELLRDIVAGLGYVRRHSQVLQIIVLAFASGIFAMGTIQTLAPVLIADVYYAGAGKLSMLFVSFGVGSFLSSFGLATFSGFRHKGRLLFIAVILAGCSLIAFGQLPWFIGAVVAMGFIGLANSSSLTSSITIVQSIIPNEVRGRVMSLMMLQMGVGQLGGFVVGSLGQALGVRLSLAILGATLAALAAAMFMRAREVRRLA